MSDSTLTGDAIQTTADLAARRRPLVVHLSLAAAEGTRTREYLVVDRGGQPPELKDVTVEYESLSPNPIERSGTVALATMGAFVDFVNRYKQPNSVLLADEAKAHIRCAFDFHDPVNAVTLAADPLRVLDGNAPTGFVTRSLDDPKPRWNRFSATYSFPQTKEWKVWSEHHRVAMSQIDLALFLEDNFLDIVDIDSPDKLASGNAREILDKLNIRLGNHRALLTAAKDLVIRADTQAAYRINPNTGETILSYQEDHTTTDNAGQTIVVPTAFAINISVFRGAHPYELFVRLKHAKNGMTTKWVYDIYNIERAREAAFADTVAAIRDGVDLPCFDIA